MNSKPLVSVIIPTYNYSIFITEAIDSIDSSDFSLNENVEIIVIDDGSTDNTKEKLEQYGTRITYIYQQNLGKAEATRIAIECAKGKYIFNLDADDFFLPHKIRKVVDIFESDPEIFHIAHPAKHCLEGEEKGKIENIPQDILNRKISGNELLSYFYRRGILFGGGSTFAARADVLKRFVIPREVDMYIDEYLVIATNCQGGYSYFLDDPLSAWRIHGKNFSVGKTEVDQLKLRERTYRNLASVEAVLANLIKLGVEEEIFRIYRLKYLALALSVKEQFGEKSWTDILSLYQALMEESVFFGADLLKIVRSYKLLNRTLPSSIISFLKRQRSLYSS